MAAEPELTGRTRRHRRRRRPIIELSTERLVEWALFLCERLEFGGCEPLKADQGRRTALWRGWRSWGYRMWRALRSVWLQGVAGIEECVVTRCGGDCIVLYCIRQ